MGGLRTMVVWSPSRSRSVGDDAPAPPRTKRSAQSTFVESIKVNVSLEVFFGHSVQGTLDPDHAKWYRK